MKQSDRTPTYDKSVLDNEEKTKKIVNFFSENTLNLPKTVNTEVEK